MRYDVQQQIDDVDKALAILGLREIPNMKQPTKEEFEYALKKAESCMKLVIHEMIRQDKTMKEMYCKKEENQQLLKLPCKIGDTVYIVEDNEIKNFAVYSFDIRHLQMFACNDEGKRINIKQFGKTAFLSKEEAALHIKTQEEKDTSTESLIGKRYLGKQGLTGALKEVISEPNKWGDCVVKDLKTGKEHLYGRRLVQNEVDEKSFEEWWDELDDIEKEEYNAIMSKENEDIEK